MKRIRRFCRTDDEILQVIDASASEDDENQFELDDEDIGFLENDIEDLESDVEIEIEDVLSSEEPLTSKTTVTKSPRNQIPLKSATVQERQVTFKWRKTKDNYVPPTYEDPDYEYGKVLLPNLEAVDEMPEISEVFNAVCDFDTLMDMIIQQSNIYCQQKGIVYSINKYELKAFFGIILVMSIHRLPETRLYWSTLPIYSVPMVSNVMTRSRFEEIRSNLHFANNAMHPTRDDPSYDRAYKIRPVLNHFNVAFGNSVTESKRQSIDEHMVKFKGRNIMKQYMKDKPISWGFKLWCRCDASTGYLHKIDIYTGRKDRKEVGIGESVILKMSAGLENLGIELYFDNFFNSPLLLHNLKVQGIRACGTLRRNRAQMPKFDSDKTFKRGDFISFESDGVTVVKWMDNRAVHIGSNFLNTNDTITVKRRQAGSAERIIVKCPEMISKYNKGMGGVDLMDQRKSYYENSRKSKIKFYLRLFFDLIDLGVLNAYIIYDKLSTNSSSPFSISLLEFRSQLASQLINSFSSRKYETSTTPRDGSKRARLSTAKLPLSAHHLTRMDSGVRKRCIVCTKNGIDNRTNSICSTCNKPFCYTNERNCFEIHHK